MKEIKKLQEQLETVIADTYTRARTKLNYKAFMKMDSISI